jgi:hypothetical protein
VQGLLYQNWIIQFKSNYFVWAGVDIGCNFIAVYCMYPKFKAEKRELTGFQKNKGCNKKDQIKEKYKKRLRIF